MKQLNQGDIVVHLFFDEFIFLSFFLLLLRPDITGYTNLLLLLLLHLVLFLLK